MLEEDKKGILLESGTNEIEVMEFTIDGSLYGINVAKVKEGDFQAAGRRDHSGGPAEIFTGSFERKRAKRPVYCHKFQQNEYCVPRSYRGGDQPYFLAGYPKT